MLHLFITVSISTAHTQVPGLRKSTYGHSISHHGHLLRLLHLVHWHSHTPHRHSAHVAICTRLLHHLHLLLLLLHLGLP